MGSGAYAPVTLLPAGNTVGDRRGSATQPSPKIDATEPALNFSALSLPSGHAAMPCHACI
jgi:hypothetical protein